MKDIRDYIDYDPDTGVFTNKVTRGPRAKKGDRTGTYDKSGYRIINSKGKQCKEHRLAFLFVKGSLPEFEVDHKNGIKDDNRFCNLREASTSQNQHNKVKQKNNSSNFKGVSWHKRVGKWIAQTRFEGKLNHLGYFDDLEEAHQAYCDKAKELFGEYFNDGH